MFYSKFVYKLNASFRSNFCRILLIRFDVAIIRLYKTSLSDSIVSDGSREYRKIDFRVCISVMVFQSSFGCFDRECCPLLNPLLFIFYVKYSRFVFLVYLSFNDNSENQAICQFWYNFDSRTIASLNLFCHLREYHVCLFEFLQ